MGPKIINSCRVWTFKPHTLNTSYLSTMVSKYEKIVLMQCTMRMGDTSEHNSAKPRRYVNIMVTVSNTCNIENNDGDSVKNIYHRIYMMVTVSKTWSIEIT